MEVKALVDTGSSVNLIGEQLANRIGLCKNLRETAFELVGVTGAILQTFSVLNDQSVFVEGVELK